VREVAAGGLAGLAFGLGVLLVLLWLRARRPLPVFDRVAPFVLAGHVAPRPSEPLRVPPRSAAIAAVGALAGGTLVFLLAGGPAAAVAGAAAGGAAALALSRQVRAGAQRRRAESIDDALPDVAELLACAVSAGESLLLALARAGEECGGPLAGPIRQAVAAVHAGAGLEDGLREWADASRSDAVRRFVDAVLVARERGTPLAEVLQALAADARARQRRRMVERAGRRDIAMLVPVVFLVLPAVVVVALYPAVVGLRLIVP
jgi:tight adherence protein C